MKMTARRPSTAEECKLETEFESLRQRLLERNDADFLEKHLAYWSLPSDRGLPLAFLSRTLSELLGTPFRDLLATPGVGFRKMTSLLNLLDRANHEPLPDAANAVAALPQFTPADGTEDDADFAAGNASEAHWAVWCETVRRHEIGHETLGRLAPTLQALPTVIWNTPLSFYVDRTLTEIRNLKTHGEKRVRAIIEIFAALHRTLGGAARQTAYDMHLTPRFVRPLTTWLTSVLIEGPLPDADELRRQIAQPLVEQIRHDVGETVAQLAADRLGLAGPPQSVRKQAEDRDLTRARVYQLFDDCAKVMAVRWPEGEWLLVALDRRLRVEPTDAEGLRLAEGLIDLFYRRPTQAIATPMGSGALTREPLLAT